jgi:hypothetical protein
LAFNYSKIYFIQTLIFCLSPYNHYLLGVGHIIGN